MSIARIYRALPPWLSFAGLALTACSSDGGEAPTTASTFSETTCEQCLVATCSAAKTTCYGIEQCKAYLSCVFACPAKNNHEVESTCAKACVTPTATDATAALTAYATCSKANDGQDGDPPGATCASECNK